MKYFRLTITLGVVLAIFLTVQPTAAQLKLDLPACIADGECQVADLVNMVVYVGKFLQALAGSIAFALFIYGGVLFLIAGGRSEYVTKAKTVLTAATIGLIIVLAAYVLVIFLERSLGAKNVRQLPGSTGAGTREQGVSVHCPTYDPESGNRYACIAESDPAARQSRIDSGECVPNRCANADDLCCLTGRGN